MALEARCSQLELRIAELSTACAQLGAQLERASVASLKAELEDIRSANDIRANTLRRELGRLWKRVGQAEADAEDEVDASPEAVRARLRALHPGPRAQLADPATHRK